MKRSRGVITVFFSLLASVFLSLAFVFAEAVRFGGARAECQNATVLGNWSVFGEYEKQLLEDYDVFGVDLSYGEGSFSTEKMKTRLTEYLRENTELQDEGITSFLSFAPWNARLTDCRIEKYALISDNGGDPFYQQVVAYMRDTAAVQLLDNLQDRYQDAEEYRQKDSEFETRKQNSEKDLESASSTADQMAADIQEQRKNDPFSQAGEMPGWEGNTALDRNRVRNPLDTIKWLMRHSILEEVCGSLPISGKKTGRGLPSKRGLKRGTLAYPRKYNSLADTLLFRQYLRDHFPDFTEQKEDMPLDYQLEYLIGGKGSDEKNLKKAVKQIVALREAYNYLFLTNHPEMCTEAQNLAFLIIGWTGIPQLVEALKNAILIGWSYGESLVDARILVHGGRIPLMKEPSDWHVPLNRLFDLQNILESTNSGGGRGKNYTDYLELFLNLQSVSSQKKRVLDLVEMNIRSQKGMDSFRIDNCCVGIEDKAVWNIPPQFSRVPAAFLWTGTPSVSFETNGRFLYDV